MLRDPARHRQYLQVSFGSIATRFPAPREDLVSYIDISPMPAKNPGHLFRRIACRSFHRRLLFSSDRFFLLTYKSNLPFLVLHYTPFQRLRLACPDI